MCLAPNFSADSAWKDLNQSLNEVGVVTGTPHTILYDFDPVMDPLLSASLKSKDYDAWISSERN